VLPQNVCGNGVQESVSLESCDDGNTSGGDGCSATCALEPDSLFAATTGASQLVSGELATPGEREVVQIDVASTIYFSAEVFAPSQPSCAADPLITLMRSDGVVIGSDNDDGVSTCSLINRTLDTFARLTAGTYFLIIEENGRDFAIGAYQVQLGAFAADVCGDAITEYVALEQCDDGNTNPVDGCSATCQFELVDTFSLPGPQVAALDSINPAFAVDSYRLDVTGTSYVRVEVYAPSAPDCGVADTFVRLIDASYNPIGTDNDDGRRSCSLLNPEVDGFMRLAAGAYYLSVEENGRNSTIAGYEMRITSWPVDQCGNRFFEPSLGEQCDDGNLIGGDGCSATCTIDVTAPEVEPNGTIATGNTLALNAPGLTHVTGSITPIGDADYFRFVVPPGPLMVLRARTYSTAGDPRSVCAGGLDTRLRLYSSAGAELENNDDIAGAANRCSFIDGAFPDSDPDARLSPGTYYLQVTHYNNSAVLGPYFLEVRLEPL
jgi:cysteine-rich repeat protein